MKLGGRGTFSSASYWLGPDHLLVVEVSNYVERYRRFYFRDTQAVLVQQNNYRLLQNIAAFVLMTLILVVFLMSMSGQRLGYISLTVLAVLELAPLAMLLVNNLSGPTCNVHLRTAVQTQKLASISRWKKAELLLAEIGPPIQSAQAAFTPLATVSPGSAPESFPEPVAPVELPPDAPPPPTT